MLRKIRLYLDLDAIAIGQQVTVVEKHAHYLQHVMRVNIGDELSVLNGKNGIFLATVQHMNKKSVALMITDKLQDFCPPAFNICLAFAVVKKTELIAKNATELGVSSFQPLLSERTIIRQFNAKSFKDNVVEAVEQCERTDVPTINPLSTLAKWLQQLNTFPHRLLWADEGNLYTSGLTTLAKALPPAQQQQPIFLCIGPEGGFSPAECQLLTANQAISWSLGKYILRAETAASAGLAILQSFLAQ